MRAVGIAVEREEVIPGECDVDVKVFAAADGVANVAIPRRVLRLQLHADTDAGDHDTHAISVRLCALSDEYRAEI
jgi:hypothetical protein